VGGLIGVGQALGYGIGVGVQRMAVEERIKNGRDHQQLDRNGERDFFCQRMVQESGHGRFHEYSNIFASAVPTPWDRLGLLFLFGFKRIDQFCDRR